MSRWFRFYEEALDDPKVQLLDGDTFKAWVNILCLACKNDGKIPDLKAVAFALRIDDNGALTVLERLHNAGLIDRANGGPNGWHYAPHGWGKRQYKSDTSNDRVKRYRAQKCNVTVTPPDTDTDTDNTPSLRSGVARARDETEPVEIQKPEKPKRKSEAGERIPPDWQPDESGFQLANSLLGSQRAREQIEIFRDYWNARAGPQAKKLDWQGTWRNWVKREAEKPGGVYKNATNAISYGNKQGRVSIRDVALRKLREELNEQGGSSGFGGPIIDVLPA